MLAWMAVIVLSVSHGVYLVPFVRSLRRKRVPSAMEFVGLSAVLYFDLGVVLEAMGWRYESAFFAPVFEASPGRLVLAIALMAAAPWLIRLGAGRRVSAAGDGLTLKNGWYRRAFYGGALLVCAVCVAIPVAVIGFGAPLWEMRFLLGQAMGAWIEVLTLPMCLLAFYVRLDDARSWKGKGFTAFLLASSVVATVAMGERTLLLLPFVIVVLFSGDVSWKKWAATAIAGVVVAAWMLPAFKFAQEGRRTSLGQLVAETVGNDFYRAPELVTALGMSSAIGTHEMGYSGAGYVYASLLFVPRSIAEFKGNSSATSFTARVMQEAEDSLSWGFGISAVSEAVLNFGFLLAPLVLVAYGAALGWLTRRAERWTALRTPLCLAGLWLFGYHLPALLALFGTMALVGVICERWFAGAALAGISAERATC
ncbi:MAG TPA: hypothetical protein VGL89_01125 [Candidatus Koribacter sp.]|jgi:hypothetical protein